jgi:hypothetical protein
MSKTIEFNDVKLKTVEFYEDPAGLVYAQIIYALIDIDGKLWPDKGYLFKDADFTPAQRTTIHNILMIAKNKIKIIEGI